MSNIEVVPMSVKIEDPLDGDQILKNLERYGRTCYKSESAITLDSAKNFVTNIIKRGHESVIEHEKISVRVICDRGVTHEIVRHRLASYSQESTRYCDYSGELQFINPHPYIETGSSMFRDWLAAMHNAADSYQSLRNAGAPPQMARSVLPNSLKTEIVMTMNLREWRHFFRLRCAKAAHPQMRAVAFAILALFQGKIPIIFDNLFEN